MIQDLFKRLESCNEFVDYKKRNPNAYLVSCFIVFEEKNMETCAFNFYSPEKDQVTAFEIQKELKELPSEGIFKKEKSRPGELNLDLVKTGLKDIFDIVRNHKWKRIFIVLSGQEPLWSVSYFDALIVTNIKIDAQSGKILEEKTEPIANFKE